MKEKTQKQPKQPQPREMRVSSRFAIGEMEITTELAYAVSSTQDLDQVRGEATKQLLNQTSAIIDAIKGKK